MSWNKRNNRNNMLGGTIKKLFNTCILQHGPRPPTHYSAAPYFVLFMWLLFDLLQAGLYLKAF